MSIAFDTFWAAWPAHPRKVDRLKCLAKWERFGLDLIAAEVMDSVAAWKTSETWTEGNGRFVPMPATWLNQRRWEVPPAALTPAAHLVQQTATVAYLQQLDQDRARMVTGDELRRRVAEAKARIATRTTQTRA